MTVLPEPYYRDAQVTLYHGDVMDIAPLLDRADAVLADPPYAETSLAWDRWPSGWPALAARLSDQLWCFGSFRMFMDRMHEMKDWSLAQDVVWEKHNGSSGIADRFRRVHEHAVHFYQGNWRALHKEPQFTQDATARSVRRKKRPAHWGELGDSTYTSQDGGPRLTRSVIYARSCHGFAVNETQKPEEIVTPLVQYSVPVGGLLVDFFSGSGTGLVVAKQTGRRAIGIEKRESQCELAAQRLTSTNEDLS